MQCVNSSPSSDKLTLELFTCLLCACRANTMAKIGFRTIANVGLDLLPIAMIITYFLTPGANREQAFQGLDLSKCLLEFYDKLLTLCPRPLPLCDVSCNGRYTNYRIGVISDRRYC